MDEHNICPGLFTKLLFTRLIAIYSSWKICSMFPPTYISCNYCCVTFVSPSSTFVTPRISRRRHPEGHHVYIYIYIYYIYCYCSRLNAFERCSQFVLSFFYEIAVGVGGSHERDQSAPTQTVPHQVGFGSNRDCGINKVSWAPHDDGLGWSHTPDTSIYATYIVPGTCPIWKYKIVRNHWTVTTP